jgi:hypothetical protein
MILVCENVTIQIPKLNNVILMILDVIYMQTTMKPAKDHGKKRKTY